MNKIVLYSNRFKPKKEFLDFIKMIGYNDYKDINCRLDKAVIKFVESKLEKYHIYDIYKGEETNDNMSGFKGMCYLSDVELTKLWTIQENNEIIKLSGQYEGISYVDIEILESNFTIINYTNK